MKWNILVGSLVLCVGLSSQSFGFDLLDRMLGSDCCQPKCCAPKPRCCAPKPKCCAPKPRCCTPKPKCCAPKPKCCPKRSCCHSNLLAGLFNFNSCCKPKCCPKPKCCAPKPRCCPKPKCCTPKPRCCTPKPKCCKPRCCTPNLLAGLSGLFNRGCCQPKCGGCSSCGSGGCEASGGGGDEAAPMPPAPVVDSSAFIPTKGYIALTKATVTR